MRYAARYPALAGVAMLAGFLATIDIAIAESPGTHASGPARNSREQDQLCANIAASVEAARFEQKRRILADLEKDIAKRLEALETKKNELRAQIEKIDAFEQRVNEALVAFYAGMKPDAAAAHLAELEDETAAALLMKLKTKISAKILNEMSAARGAALVKRIARQRPSGEGVQAQ
jgi:flagellar motility protein MotE (MotC chaperone)